MEVLWVITEDHAGTGHVGLHSADCKTPEDEARCTVKFQLQDWDGNIRYEGKINPEVLDEDILFDFAPDCYVFTALDADNFPSLKGRSTRIKDLFIEQQSYRKERRWAKNKSQTI